MQAQSWHSQLLHQGPMLKPLLPAATLLCKRLTATRTHRTCPCFSLFASPFLNKSSVHTTCGSIQSLHHSRCQGFVRGAYVVQTTAVQILKHGLLCLKWEVIAKHKWMGFLCSWLARVTLHVALHFPRSSFPCRYGLHLQADSEP